MCSRTRVRDSTCVWRNEAAKWAWVLPTAWFGLRLALVLGGGSSVYQLSGSGCAYGARSPDCLNFFLFTIPFMRGLSYSLGRLHFVGFSSIPRPTPHQSFHRHRERDRARIALQYDLSTVKECNRLTSSTISFFVGLPNRL